MTVPNAHVITVGLDGRFRTEPLHRCWNCGSPSPAGEEVAGVWVGEECLELFGETHDQRRQKIGEVIDTQKRELGRMPWEG